jgi:YebC/PmpR family DNA-binding regulatory protein
MGRAYEVRKADIQKTGAAKGKIYSMYAKEIYQAAKTGGTEVTSNFNLKRLLERAKKEQVPADIIKRAIDKVSGGADENYDSVRYELFGPNGSTVIVDCLTDNLNRTVSSIRTVLNKTKCKMGSIGSITYNYDNLCIIGLKNMTEEEALEALITADVDADMETEEDTLYLYGKPEDNHKIKEALLTINKEINFEMDEIAMLPKEKITLTGDDLETFNKLINMLDEIEDVQKVYHNVEI